MRRCQWCKHGIPMVDASEVAYVECGLIPPTPLALQSVVTKAQMDGGTGRPELLTEVRWVRPPMALRGWCGQFQLSVWKWLFSRGPRT